MVWMNIEHAIWAQIYPPHVDFQILGPIARAAPILMFHENIYLRLPLVLSLFKWCSENMELPNQPWITKKFTTCSQRTNIRLISNVISNNRSMELPFSAKLSWQFVLQLVFAAKYKHKHLFLQKFPRFEPASYSSDVIGVNNKKVPYFHVGKFQM